MKHIKTYKNKTARIAFLSVLTLFLSCNQLKKEKESLYSDEYLNFPNQLSPTTPYDVNFDLEKKLLAEKKIDEAQRLFDILGWQMFISLNWPRNEKGEPRSNISDTGNTIWDSWKESFEVFKENGSAPTIWGGPLDVPSKLHITMNKKIKVLYRTNKFAVMPADSADEINQAFTKPIWDQNGNMVRYEIRMNKRIVDYLTENELYNLNGQVAFSKAGKKISFPSGSIDKEGIMEVKLAWKILDPEKDIAERYLNTEAYVFNKDNSYSLKKVGLVGMHIATKTKSSPQWIWATFEHVDNLETNPLTTIHGKKLKPSFYDPECPTCAVNKFYDTLQKPIKNQIQRVLPIPMATQELNKSVQQLLASQNSALQYYQLIGVQWPTDPNSAPYPLHSKIYTLPEAVANKSGGKPTPLWVTNMVMETYFQGGTSITTTDSFNIYLGNEPAYFQIEGGPHNDPKNTNKLIFGTESCVGCHSSSSIAVAIKKNKAGKDSVIFGGPRMADFDWLLQLNAHLKSNN